MKCKKDFLSKFRTFLRLYVYLFPTRNIVSIFTSFKFRATQFEITNPIDRVIQTVPLLFYTIID